MKALNYGIAGFMILIAMVAYAAAGSFVNMGGYDIGPAVFPRGIAFITVVLSIFLIISTYSNSTLTSKVKDIFTIQGSLQTGKGLLLFIGYFILMKITGFLPATLLFMIIFIRFLGVKDWKKRWIVPLLSTVIIYYVFNQLFNVQLPTGMW